MILCIKQLPAYSKNLSAQVKSPRAFVKRVDRFVHRSFISEDIFHLKGL